MAHTDTTITVADVLALCTTTFGDNIFAGFYWRPRWRAGWELRDMLPCRGNTLALLKRGPRRGYQCSARPSRPMVILHLRVRDRRQNRRRSNLAQWMNARRLA